MEWSSAKTKHRKEDVRLRDESDERKNREWLQRREEDERRPNARSSGVRRLVDPPPIAGDDGAFLPADDNGQREK